MEREAYSHREREVGKEPSRWILFEFPAPGLKEWITGSKRRSSLVIILDQKQVLAHNSEKWELALITIYILFWIFIFQFPLLKFNFYINFGPYFYNCYLLFPYHFFIEIFYLSNLVLILLIVTYFFWNNLWNVNYYYFNFFIFYFFYFLDLIFIILIIIYFIWDNLWNYIFFNFILIQLFNL